MTWLIIGIIAWLACGFVAAGFENAYWLKPVPTDDYTASVQRRLAFSSKSVCLFYGPLTFVAAPRWIKCGCGWLAPWRTQ